jgi:hypothetical protein
VQRCASTTLSNTQRSSPKQRGADVDSRGKGSYKGKREGIHAKLRCGSARPTSIVHVRANTRGEGGSSSYSCASQHRTTDKKQVGKSIRVEVVNPSWNAADVLLLSLGVMSKRGCVCAHARLRLCAFRCMQTETLQCCCGPRWQRNHQPSE